MKKKLLLCVMLMSVLAVMFSCKLIKRPNSGSDEIETDCIFAPGVEIAVIYNSALEDVEGIADTLYDNTGIPVSVMIDKAEKSAHEIVIGNTSREISTKAYELLSKKIKREVLSSNLGETEAEWDTVGYAVYSDGSSIAIVWSDERVHDDPIWHPSLIKEIAIDYFAKNFLGGSTLKLEAGYIKTETFSISEFLAERGKRVLDEKWAKLEAAIPETYSAEIVTSLKSLYEIYTNDMVSWMANLYDPEIGGWYWSNSARDTEGFLPSIEETYEALNFVVDTGMAELFDNDYVKALPREILDKAGQFIYNLQDPEDGYFYHPQWPKEYIRANGLQSRITRDIGSAKTVLKKLGITPKYPDGGLKSEDETTGRLGKSTVTAVSKVIAANDMLSQFDSVENFKEYLAELDLQLANINNPDTWAYQFYYYGNLFQSTTGYINSNPQYQKMLIEFFDKHQNTNNGLWSDTVCYNATNAIHKIGSVYNSIGGELKHVDKMVDAIFDILMFDVETTPSGAGVDIYNAWSCFPYIYNNIKKSGNNSPESIAKCNEIKARVYDMAAEMIDNTKEHMIGFKRDDGSFSYSRSGASSSAQGCPISVAGVVEGNVNGNSCGSIAVVQHIMKALELEEYTIPFFTEAERVSYVRMLKAMQPVIKGSEELGVDVTYDFDDIPEKDLPAGFDARLDSGRNPIPDTFIYVTSEEDGNKAIEVVAKHRGNDDNARNLALSFPIENLSPSPNVARLSFDIKLISADCITGKIIELSFRTRGSTTTVYPMFNLKSDGTVELYDYDGDFICELGKANEYISMSIEYYWNEGVYKVYVDGLYRGCGDSTYNNSSHSRATQIFLGSSSGITAHYFLDNIRAVSFNKEYSDGALEILDEKVYTFDDDTLPEDIKVLDGSAAVEKDENGNGYLTLNGASVKIPVNIRSFTARTVAFDTVISPVSNAANDNLLCIMLYNDKDILLWNVNIGINAEGNYYLYDTKSFSRTDTSVKADGETPLKLEHYYALGPGECQLALKIYLGEGEDEAVLSYLPYTERYIAASVSYAQIKTGGVAVKLDNIKMETVLTEFEYGEIPTVTNKPDSETLDFEDRNVGANLPERIEGDAEIGAELTDTNRYLMISDTDKQNSKTVTITPYGTAEGATHVIFEFDIEYLKSSLKALHDFYLVDDSGKEIHFAELYGYSYSGPAPHIRMYRQIEGKNEFTMMDSAPNVVDRAFYLKGERAGASCTSNTKVQFVVDLESGDVTVTYRMNYSYVYKALTTSVKALKIVSTEAGVSVLTIDNLSAKYVDASAVLDPTPEDFEGNYKSEVISWECTHSDALGLPSSATNLHFDSGISVTYPTGGYTNVHGATAQVLEENGNKYLNMTAPKRINGRDRAHGLSLLVEKCSYSPNAYVYETDLKLDSVLADGSESQKAYLQIVVRSQTGTYVQYNMTGSVAGKVDLVGLALADWDEWFTLRLEYYPEQEKMQVYVKIGNGSYEYRGDLDRATTSSSAKEGDFSTAVLKGSIASIDISGANDASRGFSFNVDNASLYSTVLEYNGEQTPIVPEGGNTAPDNPGEGGGTNPPVDPPVDPPVVPPVITPDPILPDVKDHEFDIDDSLLDLNEGITDEENFDEWTN